MRPTRAVGVLLLLMGGCAAPPEIYELADKTGANVGIVGARLSQLAQESDRVVASRADAALKLREANARIRADYTYDVALVRKVGEGRDLDLVEDMKKWGSDVDAIFAGVAEAIKKQREALTAGQTKIDTKAPALQKVAQTLSALAKQESTVDRVKALRSFASEVRDEMKQQLDSGSQSARDAQKLIEHVRDTHSIK
jgi:hypothetical protein